jgi:hypothetical protein
MTIPFIDLFKKLSERFSGPRAVTTAKTEAEPPAAAHSRVSRVKKPSHPSFSKTVLPNRTRSLAPPDPFRAAAGVSQPVNPSLQLTPGRIVTGANPPVARSRDLPRALALALEPKLERAVSLRLSDFIDQVPAGFVKPVEILDLKALVSLKASEIEKGMAEGKPSVSLMSLYQQVPEIFLRSVPVEDETRIPLPYDKVYAQFKTARVREDQESDPDIPQVDTPILKVTVEETKRFGTKMEPLQTSALPPVSVELATAEALAKAEPEPIARETAKPSQPVASPHPVISLQSLNWSPKQSKPIVQIPEDKANSEVSPESLKPSPKEARPAIEIPSKFPTKLSINQSTSPAEIVSEAPKAKAEVSPAPKPKIPFQFPPKGTGVPASERVPASTGPPVPINLSVSPSPIPFKSAPEVSDAPVKPTQVKQRITEPSAKPEPAQSAPVEPASGAEKPLAAPGFSKISLALKPVLQSLPSFQLNGDTASVPEDIHIEFPLSLVEPQLAKGRVAISQEAFRAAIPEAYRSLFQPDVANTEVLLPLQEVLKNLPDGVLNLRPDQEKVVAEKEIETPFSIRAKEDAKHFIVPAQSVPALVTKPAVEPKPEAKVEMKPAQRIEAAKLEHVEGEEGSQIDVKEVITRTGALAGVKACAIMFSDGLNLAGTLPPQMRVDGLCAMAPSLLQKIDNHMRETKLGNLVAVTMYAEAQAVSFFAKGNICLAVLHGEEALAAEARGEIADLVEKLSRTYTHPEISHVDH